MQVNVKITNLEEIRSAFSKAPIEMTKELNKAIRTSIIAIEGQSKLNSPVLTGRLRASHASLFSNLRGETGPNTNYAIFVHEGTRYMKARPFLLEAVKTQENKIEQNFKDAVQNVLDKIGREV